MKKQQKANLARLIWYLKWLKRTDPKAFDLRQWVRRRAGVRADAVVYEASKDALRQFYENAHRGDLPNCGTAACLVGHLPAVFPEDFRAEGNSHGAVILGHKRICSEVNRQNLRRKDSMRSTWYLLTDVVARRMTYTDLVDILSRYLGGTTYEWRNIIFTTAYLNTPQGVTRKAWLRTGGNVPLSSVIKRVMELYESLHKEPAPKAPRGWRNMEVSV